MSNRDMLLIAVCTLVALLGVMASWWMVDLVATHYIQEPLDRWVGEAHDEQR